MRLLHVTDFHFREPWFHWLAAQATNYDACCLTGDMLDMFPGSRIGLRTQARWVRDWLREFPGQLYACTGNHDWWPSDHRVVDNDAANADCYNDDAVPESVSNDDDDDDDTVSNDDAVPE